MPALIEIDTQLRRLIAANSPDGSTDFYILPDGSDLNEIPQDPKNPLTDEKIELGKLMFFDTGLAADAMKPSGIGTYSCGSCHIPEAGFYPDPFHW